MKTTLSTRVLSLLIAAVLSASALGDAFHPDAPGLTLYVRVFTSATASVAAALTEGTGGAVGLYYVTDANLLAAGLSSASTTTHPDGFVGKVFSGTPSTTANDPWRGNIVIPWNGTAAMRTPVDLREWNGTAVATPNVAGVPKVDTGYVVGNATSATNLNDTFDGNGSSSAVMRLAGLDVVSSGRHAVVVSASGGNYNALDLTGVGSGKGVQITAGATGIGLAIDGGQTSGQAIYAATTSGNAIEAVGGTNGNGFVATGTGTGEGAKFTGGASGNGFEIDGGASGDDFVLTGDDWPGLATLVDFMLDDGTSVYDRTTDSLQEIRDNQGSGVYSANVTQWNGSAVATPSVAGVPEVDVTHINGSAAQAYNGVVDTSNVMAYATVTAVTSQTRFNVDAGFTGLEVSDVDNTYNDKTIVMYDTTNSDFPWAGEVDDYDGGDREFILSSAPGFTIAVGDTIKVFVNAGSNAAGGGSEVSPFLVHDDHTWKFFNPGRIESSNTIQEATGSNGVLLAMDFGNTIPNDTTISTVNSVTVSPSSGAPVMGDPMISTNKRQVHVEMDASSATAATYTVTVNITTVDSQTFTRRGTLRIR